MKRNGKPTENQHRQMCLIYHFIEDYQRQHNHFTPTIQVIAETLHYGPKAIDYWIKHLKARGWIRRERGSRQIQLLGINERERH